MPTDPNQAVADTRRWLERAVIGLNLCPFAKSVLAKGQVHFAVSWAADWNGLLADLAQEATDLLRLDPTVRDTSLLIAPAAPQDFFEFHGLVTQGERQLAAQGFAGTLQLASFHPRFQFAGTEADAITNCTNRAPWPTLHLLREASVDRAVQAFPDAADIYEANMETLRRLGRAGWKRLGVDRP